MKKKIFLAAALILASVLAFWIFHKTAGGPATPGDSKHGSGADGKPLPVQAAIARSGDIDVYINALGTVTARNTATVKTRVNGLLERINFRDGQKVKEGELLAQIDPRPFQVLLDQAKGQLARDQALLVGAKLDLDRYRDLWAKDSIAKQQLDDQEALVLQDEGTVLSDRAQVESAQLNVDFTRITAPLSGRLGIRQEDAGNMINTTDTTGLVAITQTQPIYILFAIPADNIAAVLARLHVGKTLTVDAFDRDGKIKLATGKLLTVDNQIDVTTGTVKLKAEFANADETLFPNQFVNARLRVETMHNAILAPVAAIQRGTQGTFVYVVGQDQAVSIRTVTLGPVSGDTVAITKGLADGEQVVTDGADKLREGAKVEVTTPGAHKAAGKDSHGPAGSDKGSAEERQKRWAETNARIDRGEFGEEIKKLPEEERKQRMREMRHQQEGGASQSQQ
ncbi:MAG: MdtA/MuxA family multidrug efflux RND transporter periplasmic adaptor subunit [Gallionella sp.]